VGISAPLSFSPSFSFKSALWVKARLSHSPQALAWGNTAPESSENHLNGFQVYSAARSPKLKLGEKETCSPNHSALIPIAIAGGTEIARATLQFDAKLLIVD
jgi:hypothetical protein